jgi:putative transposase
MVTPVARRQAVAHLCSSFEVSQRRACEVIGADRSSVRYLSLRPDDATIRVRLRELASVRRRFGYRRLLLMIRSEGVLINHKKLRRLYAEERLQVRRRGRRKRALGTRAPMALPQGPNQRWSLDFVSDTLTDSRRFEMQFSVISPASVTQPTAIVLLSSTTTRSEFSGLIRSRKISGVLLLIHRSRTAGSLL